MVADGFAAPSTTDARAAAWSLRLCTINPRTTFEDIERTLDRMESDEVWRSLHAADA